MRKPHLTSKECKATSAYIPIVLRVPWRNHERVFRRFSSVLIVALYCLESHVQNVASLRVWTGYSTRIETRLMGTRGGGDPSHLYSSSIENSGASPEPSSGIDFHNNPPYEYSAEVVGATGRMGSFWLVHHHRHMSMCSDGDNGNNGIAIPCPRGISPGCLTPDNSPIYVATPSAAWSAIYNETLTRRRSDLCFIGNGIPFQEMKDSTIVVPHFAVLHVCHNPTMDTSSCSPIQTSPLSPPTLIYGKHAQSIADILQKYGVQTEIVESFSVIRLHASLKLLWASCMWLLCHSSKNQAPLTVGQVQEMRREDLDRLVDELFPVLKEINAMSGNGEDELLFARKHVDDYLSDYSQSIANAIPSRELAISEFLERNGFFLRDHQPFHCELLREHLHESQLVPPSLVDTAIDRVGVTLDDVGLKAWGTRLGNGDHRMMSLLSNIKRVVIIGGGMMGSSIALALATRRPDWNITVIDESKESDFGKTTRASWAWINGNNKEPKSYQLLNQLGTQAWKRHQQIRHLVSWLGSLVRFSEYPEFVLDGGYPLEGPLSRSRVLELEPLSNWENRNAARECDNSLGFTFFFPDEGCVDPSATVRALRQAAQKLGVKFQCEQNVTNITYDDENGTVVSVESCPCNTKRSPPTTLISTPADLVVSAAGCGISAPFLGGVPLLNRPGRIEYAVKKTNNQKVEGKWLRRILVDAQRSSHVLQRSNGDIVAGGGGRLEFGGSTSTIPVDAPEEIELDDGELKAPKILSLLDLALELAPSALEGLRSHKVCHAVRPMPQDGLPVVGFQGSGLYVAITHSGVTLGPLLGSMVAAEITESLSLEILEPYRPTRFSPVQR